MRPTLRLCLVCGLGLVVGVPTGLAAGARQVAYDSASLSAGVAGPAGGDASLDSISGWHPLDGFEAPDWPNPDLWSLPRREAPTWWPSACHARAGTRSLWAFGGPIGDGAVPCSSPAPAATTSTILLHLDLRGAADTSRLELAFDLWLGFTPGDGAGVFLHLLDPDRDGNSLPVPVFGAVGDASSWTFPMRTLDLTSLVDIRAPTTVYDLRGGYWTLAWTAVAPQGAPPGGGAFIDNLSLVWEPDPAYPTPTPRPTSTATIPPTATATRTATATAEPTRNVYLPVAHKQEVEPEPTPTDPEPTPTEFPTEEPG